MAYTVLAYKAMACIFMACTIMACTRVHVAAVVRVLASVGFCHHSTTVPGSISASPTASLLRGHGRAGTSNDRLAEALVLSTGTSV